MLKKVLSPWSQLTELLDILWLNVLLGVIENTAGVGAVFVQIVQNLESRSRQRVGGDLIAISEVDANRSDKLAPSRVQFVDDDRCRVGQFIHSRSCGAPIRFFHCDPGHRFVHRYMRKLNRKSEKKVRKPRITIFG